ncbi:hypothetical protein FIBSPDRAFT_1053240 [Athelia psychrophila]|uniref:Uncharacterized protein n=1 Tax=Athelia psychrophila TaxID=1759441 RepID=A0A167X946_9AGAM|nr:hypothetical protein FIBSPDRAFT_1053240 [Fibularhizoctonia sp. CBS 109695]
MQLEPRAGHGHGVHIHYHPKCIATDGHTCGCPTSTAPGIRLDFRLVLSTWPWEATRFSHDEVPSVPLRTQPLGATHEHTRQSPPARPARARVHRRPAVPHPPVPRHLVSLPCTSRPAACRLSRTRDLPALRDVISRGECHAHEPYLRRTPHLSESLP